MKQIRRTAGVSCALALALCIGGWQVAGAQSYDFSGQWNMSTDIMLTGETSPCSFVGIADMVQLRSLVSGVATLELVSGPNPCPAEMAAEVSGTAKGTTIYNGMLFGGLLGEALFTADLLQVKALPTLAGSFSVTVGPFAGSGGDWGAVLKDDLFGNGFEGLFASMGLLLGAGLVAARRRSQV